MQKLKKLKLFLVILFCLLNVKRKKRSKCLVLEPVERSTFGYRVAETFLLFCKAHLIKCEQK